MLKFSMRAFLIAGALSVPMLFTPAQAGTDNSAMAGKAQASQSADVSDAEVHQFAALFMKISSIRMSYGQKLKAAKDKSEAASLKKEGGAKIKQAVNDSPLSAQRYNQIAKATASDPGLKKRLMAEIDKMKADASQQS